MDKKKAKKKRAKRLKIGACVLIAAVVGIAVFAYSARGALPAMSYTEISKGEIIDSLSAKGSVESVEKRVVYSTLGYTIMRVDVSAGDRVAAGQTLAALDTENLELDIAGRKADLSVSQENSLKQLENSTRVYNEATENLDNSTNSQILSAESSLKTAKMNLSNAQKSYDEALYDYEQNADTRVTGAESALVSAELDLEIKKDALETASALFEAGGATQDELRRAEDAHTMAQNKYSDAVVSLESAQTAQKRALEQAERSLQSARLSYDNALAALDTVQINALQEIERLKSSVESAEITTNLDSQLIAIQKLEKQLKDSTITAPIGGTVTAVYAKEGAAGSGLLFVIEDTENLKITTKIREYDVGRVQPGMPATIKSDSTGDAVYKGVIAKIDPAAAKNAYGDTNPASDIEFGTEVLVSERSDLRIGMETRLTIEIERRDGVYKVPYDAILLDEDGGGTVFVAEESGDGRHVARQVYVETGMESDFNVEIRGDGLGDGMKILNDASVVTDGMALTLK
ncbi:MAG: HlyD family efflux transporter periplasmic adaptor subunit [Clostridiales bacterium]|jgi:multidrug efflux pump subunit AcrA (membrane-fusion protein)|nr:HlyD family efflux transporter periplasmic adaptor subunit [Clostridiales bacterium]